MHIPDGFLSPQTCVGLWAASAPIWYVSWRNIKSRFEATTAAHIGMGAAFIFLLQMVNVPIPGGTSGHACGAALITIALGPSAAILAVSMALLLQAVVFGDGGIMAFGANVMTMAVAQSLAAWGVWRLIARSDSSAKVQAIGAFAAGWVAAIAGALTTGTMLGIQPLLFKTDAGAPLYFPLGLAVSLPAMLGSHALIGIVEGGITAGAVLMLQRIRGLELARPVPTPAQRRIAVGLAIMVFLVPIGILFPALMNAGDAWGEWSPEEAAEVAGQTEAPAGMVKYSETFSAPVPDYQFTEAQSLAGESVQYIGAALLGVLLTLLLVWPLHLYQQKRLARLRAGE